MTSTDDAGRDEELAVLAGRLASMAARVETLEAAVLGLGQSVAEAAGVAGEVTRLAETIEAANAAKGPPEPGGHPRVWAALSDADSAEALRDLARWVVAVLLRQYRHAALVLPPCWPAHPFAVEELDVLYWTWEEWATAGTEARARDAADWHDRWLPGVLARLVQSAELKECVTKGDHVSPVYRRPVPARLDEQGWAPEQLFIEEMGRARRASGS